MDSSFITNISGCIDSATQLMNGNLQLVYYSHIPIGIIACLIGFFVIAKNRKDLSARVMFFLSMIFALWVVFNFISWISSNSIYVYFSWSIFTIINSLLFLSCLYLVYIYKNDRDMPIWFKILLGLIFLPILFLTPTAYNMGDFMYTDCYPVDNAFLNYFFYFEIIITSLIAVIAVWRFIISEGQKRYEIVLISLASITFLLTLFGTGYIADTLQRYDIEIYGVFSMPLFLGFLAYLIVKFRAFDVKMLGSQALVWSLVIIVGSEFLFVTNLVNQILVGVTLLISSILGLSLVRSVKKEVAQKEQISGYVQDLSKLNGELVFKNNRLKDLDQQKTEFVSLATHQLRSPLTAMKGYASLILEGDFGQVSDEVRKAVQIVLDSANTLVNIVNDYLNVSRIELGSMKYYFNKMDFKQIVETVIAELKPNVERAGLTLSFTTEPGVNFETMVDEDKIKQVIANTIDNAQKYTKAGNLSVNLSLVTNDKDGKNEKKILYSVKDTGLGIDPKVIPKLFTKFTRAEGANTINIRGTGLGLYVAKEIVTAHKGRIWAESEGEGKGSQFYVELPVA